MTPDLLFQLPLLSLLIEFFKSIGKKEGTKTSPHELASQVTHVTNQKYMYTTFFITRFDQTRTN